MEEVKGTNKVTDEQPELELKTLVININRGYNEELKQSCRDLYGYMVYVDKVREFAKIYPREVAVKMAIDYYIKHDILADFFAAHRAEVMSTSIFEYDREAHLRQVAKENRADGWEEGHREGKIEGILDLLAELGSVPDDVTRRIQSEEDLSVLTGWLKLAAKSESMDDFVSRM